MFGNKFVIEQLSKEKTYSVVGASSRKKKGASSSGKGNRWLKLKRKKKRYKTLIWMTQKLKDMSLSDNDDCGKDCLLDLILTVLN